MNKLQTFRWSGNHGAQVIWVMAENREEGLELAMLFGADPNEDFCPCCGPSWSFNDEEPADWSLSEEHSQTLLREQFVVILG